MAGPSNIRVLMVDSEMTWRGGQAQVELLIKGLLDRGIPVALAAAPDAAIARRATEIGVACLPLRISGGLDLSAAWALKRILERDRFDIVHCHSSHAHGIGMMATRALGARWRRGNHRRPRLVVSRRLDVPVGRIGLSALKYRHGVDGFLAISEGVRDVLVRGGVNPARIELVPDGIDFAKFDDIGDTGYLRDEFELGERTALIGNVAALTPDKSQVDFIRAAKLIRERIPDAKFLIVGEGELRRKLESLIADLGLEKDVVLTGFRRDVLGILSLFRCFVLSSHLEGLCTSIMDAQGLGIPVVATRTGGVTDLVKDGETGLLVMPRRPDCIAEAVVRMLDDDELRKKCVQGARDRVKAYDYRWMVQGTVDAYHRVLNIAETTASP